MKWETIFEEVEDFRVQGRCLHRLTDILMIVLCGLIADCEDFEEIEDFANDRQAFLSTFLALPNGIPSHDTMNRVLRHLNPVSLSGCLTKWGREVVALLSEKQFCVDGKELRGTIPPGRRSSGHKHASVQVVSAWVRQAGLSLGEVVIKEKTNEIEAVPELLQLLDLQGAIISADALNCQKKTAQVILDGQGEYLLGLKANQGSLFEQVRDHFARRQGTFRGDWEKAHGRIERRDVWVEEDLRWIDAAQDWPGLACVVMTESIRLTEKGQESTKRFYISSLRGKTPQQMGEIIRGHWSVENHLHWHLDVTFGEDDSTLTKDNAPKNLSVLRKLALQLLTKIDVMASIKRKRKKAARDNGLLLQILEFL